MPYTYAVDFKGVKSDEQALVHTLIDELFTKEELARSTGLGRKKDNRGACTDPEKPSFQCTIARLVTTYISIQHGDRENSVTW